MQIYSQSGTVAICLNVAMHSWCSSVLFVLFVMIFWLRRAKVSMPGKWYCYQDGQTRAGTSPALLRVTWGNKLSHSFSLANDMETDIFPVGLVNPRS